MGQLLTLLAALPELLREMRKAIKIYRMARAEGWAVEHKEMGELIENAKTDDDRRRLVRAATDLMRKPE